MRVYTPISVAHHQHLKWSEYESYTFAKGEALAPIGIQEARRVAISMPIVICKSEKHFGPVAVQSLLNERNEYLDSRGTWAGDYVPAVYRAYPFSLEPISAQEYTLCMDLDSGLIGREGQHALFEGPGALSNSMNKVKDFLIAVNKDRVNAVNACRLLEEYGLLQCYEFEGDELGTTHHKNLYTFDEERLNKLNSIEFEKIRAKGYLPFIYSQLLSLQKIPSLVKLLSIRRREESIRSPSLTISDFESGLITFDKIR